jgi:hypothetical protein
MTLPELAPAHWYRQFVDYLAFSFNKATTFGAADVPAIKRWAELLMVAGSLIALALVTWLFPEPSTSREPASGIRGRRLRRGGAIGSRFIRSG